MKESIKSKLQLDLIKYCEQIGIPELDVPKLIFNRKEINTFRHSIGDRRESKTTLGRCYNEDGIIYVAERTSNDNRIYREKPARRKGWVRWTRHPWNYVQQRHTLVHELVHYRWPNMPHGKKFEQRIEEILRGQRFETMPIPPLIKFHCHG